MDLLTRLLAELNAALAAHDPEKLRAILILEPPFPPPYLELIAHLQSEYPGGEYAAESEERLEELVRDVVGEVAEGEDAEGRPVQGWGQMAGFVAGWMCFIRDLDVGDLLATYVGLSELQVKINSALQHPTKGILVLPTLIGYAKVLARVAIGLDKRPELIRHVLLQGDGDDGRRESLPEKAANVVRQAFITCLNDRNTAPGGIKDGKPDGKKVGIYKTANICLKVLFQADKLESCQTIFNNISNSSPPLSIYPASERVTYLYYLGKFHFSYTRFYEAQLALQKAYEDSPADPTCIPQRRLILIHLIAANILLGRFPSEHLYSVPEAHGLRDVFEPLTRAIRKGDLESYRRITKLDRSHPSAAFLCRYRMFYQLGNYPEVFLWRSLFRKVFLLTGERGATERSAPTLDLHAVTLVFQYFEKRALMSPSLAAADGGPGRRHISFVLQDFTPQDNYIDPDFEGLPEAQPYTRVPDVAEVECICASLIVQGLMNGYISKKSNKFAVLGTRKAGGDPVRAGWPNVWEVVKRRYEDRVFGWRRDGERTGGGGVIRLAGARAAGS